MYDVHCAHSTFPIFHVYSTIKVSDRQCMVFDLRILELFFRIHLRPIRRFYGAYLFSKSANSIFKILIDCPFWRDDFENRFIKNYSIRTMKNVTKTVN